MANKNLTERNGVDLEDPTKPEQHADVQEINVSGHVLELPKEFNLASAVATGITTGNTWTALGGAIIASLYNGGPPGIIYEFIAVSVFYWFIAASIAELASAIPASGGVYHWATVTAGPKYGRICGWFAGWLNFFAWSFGVSANCSIIGSMIVYAYALFHPGYEPERWHVFIAYLIVCWGCCFTVMFANRSLPYVNRIGSFLILGGLLTTIIVCAVMPSQNGRGYASSSFVWKDWKNGTGYSNNGFVFLAGMLNGAFAVGTPDCVTHIAEEIPQASKNLPKVLACQVVVGFFTALLYMISMFYAINDLDAIFQADSICPLGEIYRQVTGSNGGALGLLIVIILPIVCATVGCYITAGRTLYALARDDAAPFADRIGSVSPKWKSPLYATLACGFISTGMGAVYIGSLAAFNAFVGSFVLLTTVSFLIAILPHLLSGRKNITPGPFWMGKAGYVVNFISCVYIVVFFVIYCFPYALPTSAAQMNYTSVITVGLVILVATWWFIHGRKSYVGPQIVPKP
ncbi:amino acid/polyamine transporter I [Penicillium canariense]|uniref:Amino acid/polyamine transporter I n=1 Tax=Penicillium canariense TaxID=189055 RepID=A0A9W9HLD4_9EURO|nr:amino acid/polyamine transporter I [Penicillium canariense]KAJ5150975.1 amino acid/polyamine transporter I [Penicillium canariense]